MALEDRRVLFISYNGMLEALGQSQVIPRVCPNCLKEANVDLRYCYIRPWDIVRPTRYWQSFRYCATCAPAARPSPRRCALRGGPS